jgi:hypothetical protein
MAIDARYATSAIGSSHRKPTDYFGGDQEKFAPTKTAGYTSVSHFRLALVLSAFFTAAHLQQ